MDRECKKCGGKITGAGKKYCSRLCYFSVPKSTSYKKKMSSVMAGKFRARVERYCENCGKQFFTNKCRTRIGSGRFCGEKCRLVSFVRKNKERCEENHWQWKGGVTPENTKARKSVEYKEWRERVFERDDYTCQWCGKRGVELHADHIKPFALFKELRYEIDNGRTLCVPCHGKTSTYKASRIKLESLFL